MRDLKELIQGGITPIMNGTNQMDGNIFALFGFSTKSEKDQLIIIKLTKKNAFISKVLEVDSLAKSEMNRLVDIVTYESIDNIGIEGNFVITTIIRIFESVLRENKSDPAFLNTIIPFLLEMFKESGVNMVSTSKGLNDLENLSKLYTASTNKEQELSQMLASLGIVGQA